MTDTDEDERDTNIDDKGFFGHPKGLQVLFFSEMWERFSFYGMRALLVLYMIAELDYEKDPKAYGIYGAYGALVYAFPVVGGWIANKWIGYRNAIVLGGTFMALGHFAMAIENEYVFFLALSLLCVGNGFFKPNISSTVGRLYAPDDLRRDRGFTIFYMGINAGAFAAPLVCGYLGEEINWHYGFGAAGVGMVIGILWFLNGQRHIGKHGDPDDPELLKLPVIAGLNRLQLVWLVSFLIVPGVAYSLYEFSIAEWIIRGVSIAVLGGMLWFAMSLERIARLRLLALMVLMFFHMLFWAGFEQAGSSFNVLTKEYVDRGVMDWTVPTSMFQAVNPVFIILLGPIFALIWRKLDNADKNVSIPIKFALGLLQLGAGFYVLTLGISAAAEGDGGTVTIALFWLILCYFLHTTGELCLSPIGLSAVTKLAPKKWVGFCMGAWFLTIANAHLVAAAIAKLTASGGEDGEVLTGKAALAQYSDVFSQVAIMAVAAGVVMIILSPFINKLMGGVR